MRGISRIISSLALSGALLLIGGGCASVSVREPARNPGAESGTPPGRLFVRDFLASPETDPALPPALTRQIVERARGYVLPAWRLRDARLPEPPGWLVWGRIERVDPGNFPLRLGIGFGGGRSRLETTVWVYDLGAVRAGAAEPFLVFRTSGGSGAEPGLVTVPLTGVPPPPLLAYRVGSKTWSEVRKGTDQDARRTARMIAAVLSEELVARGWMPPGQKLRVKRDWASSFEIPENLLRN